MTGARAQRLKYHRRSVVSVRASLVPIRRGVSRPWRAGLWLIVRPAPPLETSLQVRASWLAQARDRWRSTGLVDAAGAAGRHIGEQAEWRSRYRFSSHLDVDGAVTVFREGAFVRALKPSPKGRAVHLYAGLDLHY